LITLLCPAQEAKTAEAKDKDNPVKTALSNEATSPKKEMVEGPVTKPEMDPQSAEMTALLKKEKEDTELLMASRSLLQNAIKISQKWEQETNIKSKGHIDRLHNQAERLSFSNQYRSTITIHALTVLKLLQNLDEGRIKITNQKRIDKEKEEKIKLHKEIIALQEKLKHQQHIPAVKKVVTKLKDGERLYTPNTDMPLWRIADNYGNQDKWHKIFDHPNNKGKIPQRDKNAMVKKDTILVIPDLEDEEEEE